MTAPHQATPAASKKKLPPGALKAYVASLTGTSLEYYDFAIYSVASALVFPKIFFPGNNEFVGLLLSFSAFAVGYLARPIGGVVFGRLGDKIGRKHVLVVTLMLIGIATVLIGVLPGYATIGVAAPIILVLLRLAQGIGVGGEWGGAVLLSSEFGDANKRGFWSSAAQIPAGRQPDGQRRPGRPRRDPQRRSIPLLGLARRLPRLRPAGALRPAHPAQA
jgi:MFS family permease